MSELSTQSVQQSSESFFQNHKKTLLFILVVVILLSIGYSTGILSLGGQASSKPPVSNEKEKPQDSSIPSIQSPVPEPGTSN
jgi:hypothetical protein